MTPGAILEAKGVVKRFAVRRGLFGSARTLHAVRGVDIAVAPGETLAIVGESGSGKTTLGRMLLGVEPPSEGSVILDGRPVGAWSRIERAARIQAVFQDPYSSLNPYKSVASIVALPLLARGVRIAEARAKARAVLQTVGLPPRVSDAFPDQLSGGQRQRVAIARALIIDPRVLLCDEPTSALDVSVQSQILNLIQDVSSRLRLTIVLITHNLAIVEHMADRVAVMYLGRMVELRPTADLFRHPRHPYTDALMRSVLSLAPSAGIPHPHLAEQAPDPFAPPAGCALHPRCPRASDICRTREPTSARAGSGFVECHHPLDG